MFYNAIQFAEHNNFTKEKLSTVLSILKEIHQANISNVKFIFLFQTQINVNLYFLRIEE